MAHSPNRYGNLVHFKNGDHCVSKKISMAAEIQSLTVRCPVNPLHGLTIAEPSGFRGLTLACGCQILVTAENDGWEVKPEAKDTPTGTP